MKTVYACLFTFLLASSVSAQNYRIDWYVIGSGGGHSASSNYQLDGTIGQPIVGQSSSPNYQIEAGFWVGAGAPVGPSCDYVIGDANNNGSFNGLDVVYSVSYFKGGPPPGYSCECTPGQIWYVAGDVNGSCNFNGLDVSYMVTYLKGGPAPNPCADCPPARFMIAPKPIPAVESIRTSEPLIRGEIENTN